MLSESCHFYDNDVRLVLIGFFVHMKVDFAKNTRRNMLAEYGSTVLGLIFPFLNRTLFLRLLGAEYLGLNGLFSSILGVLSLAELGFGMSIVCSMYKPVAEDDQERVCAYLCFYRTVYRWIGSGIFLAGLCLFPFLRRLVHGTIPPDINLHVLYLIHLTNTAISYFLFAYRGSVLSAYHRNDVLTNMGNLIKLTQFATVFLILLLTQNYYYYVLSGVVFTMISNLLTLWQSRRLFPSIVPRGQLPAACRRKVISDVKAIFLHKVGTIITYSFDNLVISFFLGLTSIAVYGNYYQIYKMVCGVTSSVYSSMRGGFGNRVHTESREDNFRLFLKAHRLVALVIIWCSAMMLSLYQPFMMVWTKNNPLYVRHFLTPLLMVIYFIGNQSRQVLLTYKSAANLWQQDRWKPIVGSLANLAMNVAFIHWFPEAYKLDGVILSTILSAFLIQLPWETAVLFTHFFNRQQLKRYLIAQASFVSLAIVCCLLTWWVTSCIPLSGLLGLAVKGAAAATFAGGILLTLFRQDALAAWKSWRGK